MKGRVLIISILIALFCFCGCSNDDENSNLYNTWILVSYGNESNEVVKEAKGFVYEMAFNPNGTYFGRAYGNKLCGKYVCSGNTIKIFDGDITQVYVIGSDPDRFFLDHLRDVYTYKISASELRLYYSEYHFFKFRIKEKNYE